MEQEPFTPSLTIGSNVKFPHNIETCLLDDVLAIIRSGIWRKINLKSRIKQIRSYTDEVAIRNAKSKLPYICGSVFSGYRHKDRFIEAYYMIFDIDHVPLEAVADLKARLMRLPYVLCAFRSPRDGIKVIVGFSQPIKINIWFAIVWEEIAIDIARVGSFLVDQSGKDTARACFLSYDPDIAVNRNCQPVDPQILFDRYYSRQPQKVEAKGTIDFPAPQKALPEHVNSIEEDYEQGREICSRLSQQELDYLDWIKVGMGLKNRLGDRGLDLWLIFAENPFYDDSPEKLKRIWNSFKTPKVGFGTVVYIARKYNAIA